MVSMFSVNNDMLGQSLKLGITLSKSTVERIDKARGDIPRSRYILRAIESYVVADDSSSTTVRAAKKLKEEERYKKIILTNRSYI